MMRHAHLTSALYVCIFSLVSTISHAALIDRGGGLIYDNVLDITWLQDTNYGLTDGSNDGKMQWQEANDWAAGLIYYDAVRDISYDNWRLPTLSPIDGSNLDIAISNDGTTDQGYTRTTTDGLDGGWRDSSGNPVSELGYMFYVNLANIGKCDPDGNVSPCNIQPEWDWVNNFNTGPFTNFPQFTFPDDPGNPVGNFATGTDFFDEVNAGLTGDYAWNFGMKGGDQKLVRKGAGFDRLAGWAVRDGDVGFSAVPLPAAVWLFGGGLIGLIGIARKKAA